MIRYTVDSAALQWAQDDAFLAQHTTYPLLVEDEEAVLGRPLTIVETEAARRAARHWRDVPRHVRVSTNAHQRYGIPIEDASLVDRNMLCYIVSSLTI